QWPGQHASTPRTPRWPIQGLQSDRPGHHHRDVARPLRLALRQNPTHTPIQGQVVKRITISLIEDHPATADMFVRLLSVEEGFRVASHHATAEEALERLPAIHPEVVLVDLQLPGLSGTECILRLKQVLPDVLCLVITQFDDSDLLFGALQAGADGYLL